MINYTLIKLDVYSNFINFKYFYEYNIIGIYLVIILIIILFLLLISITLNLVERESLIEKNKTYECGFEPFFDFRENIELHFYKFTLVFLLFDLEIIFLYPLSFFLNYYLIDLTILNFYIFIIILSFSFFLEYSEGVLNINYYY
jgi:NADH:ubiquinone oxidoreductase subunit 3 (subunit A)